MVIFKIKELMLQRELGQRELSRVTNIRQATIGDYVNNTAKHISLENLNILCRYFDCNIQDIIEYVEI